MGQPPTVEAPIPQGHEVGYYTLFSGFGDVVLAGAGDGDGGGGDEESEERSLSGNTWGIPT